MTRKKLADRKLAIPRSTPPSMTRKKQKDRRLPFSQRYGFQPLKTKIQLKSIDDDLRIGLWNALMKFYFLDPRHYSMADTPYLKDLVEQMWEDFFIWPIHEIEYSWGRDFEVIKREFFSFSWWKVFDFLEFIFDRGPIKLIPKFKNYCNNILEREVSAYRFVNDTIAPITSEVELTEIEEALERSKPYHPVHLHLQTALDFLADRENPNYRNSIKESICAIESIVKTLTRSEKGTLGQLLKSKKLALHDDLKTAFRKLYGWTSDAEGIRHALMEAPNLGLEDAKFILVTCSAFFNYLVVKFKS